MNIKLICVGKLKQASMAAAAEDYRERLSRFCTFEVAEVADEPAPERLSDKDVARVLEAEGKRIMAHIGARDSVAALCIEGRKFDSPAFAKQVGSLLEQGGGRLCLVVGGSNGLAPEVKARADRLISFSDMTFPHGLFRVMLMEQVYRAFMINSNRTYHK